MSREHCRRLEKPVTEHAIDLRVLVSAWNSVFYARELPLSLAIFRIGFGLLLTVESVGLVKWGSDLFGFQGLAPAPDAALTNLTPFDPQANIFWLCCNSTAWIRLTFVIHMVSCVLLTV